MGAARSGRAEGVETASGGSPVVTLHGDFGRGRGRGGRGTERVLGVVPALRGTVEGVGAGHI